MSLAPKVMISHPPYSPSALTILSSHSFCCPGVSLRLGSGLILTAPSVRSSILPKGICNCKYISSCYGNGHKNVTTTQHYLRFPQEMVKSDFPSLTIIIEKMSNIDKKVYLDTKSMDTEYKNLSKLHSYQ